MTNAKKRGVKKEDEDTNYSDEPQHPKKIHIMSDDTAGTKKTKLEPSDKGKPFTVEEARLVIELKETQKLSWKEIATRVPSRNVCSLKRYYSRLKSLTEEFTQEDKEKLREYILEDNKARWKRIGKLMGKSDVSCQKMAKEME